MKARAAFSRPGFLAPSSLQFRMTILDLTRRMDGSLRIYKTAGYSDPPFLCSEWRSIEQQGYRVSRLELGTQTGTHIDAPAHFDLAGATLESLSIERLIGQYYVVDLPENPVANAVGGITRGYANEPILFLRSHRCENSEITVEDLNLLIALLPLVWVLAGQVSIQGKPGLEFHRVIARAGKFLVEDLDPAASAQVPARGEIFALPLALVGASGAPCRVVVRELQESG